MNQDVAVIGFGPQPTLVQLTQVQHFSSFPNDQHTSHLINVHIVYTNRVPTNSPLFAALQNNTHAQKNIKKKLLSINNCIPYYCHWPKKNHVPFHITSIQYSSYSSMAFKRKSIRNSHGFSPQIRFVSRLPHLNEPISWFNWVWRLKICASKAGVAKGFWRGKEILLAKNIKRFRRGISWCFAVSKLLRFGMFFFWNFCGCTKSC